MSFGKKYLEFKKKAKQKESTKTLTLNKEHVTRAVEQYLLANSLWNDGNEINYIDFTETSQRSVDCWKLKIFYRKG